MEPGRRWTSADASPIVIVDSAFLVLSRRDNSKATKVVDARTGGGDCEPDGGGADSAGDSCRDAGENIVVILCFVGLALDVLSFGPAP
jgi:hypothetical protein